MKIASLWSFRLVLRNFVDLNFLVGCRNIVKLLQVIQVKALQLFFKKGLDEREKVEFRNWDITVTATDSE